MEAQAFTKNRGPPTLAMFIARSKDYKHVRRSYHWDNGTYVGDLALTLYGTVVDVTLLIFEPCTRSPRAPQPSTEAEDTT